MHSTPYLFGLGQGWLTKRAAKVARKHGAKLINHTDAECKCGYGCKPFTCPLAKRHWFELNTKGRVFSADESHAILKAVAAVSL